MMSLWRHDIITLSLWRHRYDVIWHYDDMRLRRHHDMMRRSLCFILTFCSPLVQCAAVRILFLSRTEPPHISPDTSRRTISHMMRLLWEAKDFTLPWKLSWTGVVAINDIIFTVFSSNLITFYRNTGNNKEERQHQSSSFTKLGS